MGVRARGAAAVAVVILALTACTVGSSSEGSPATTTPAPTQTSTSSAPHGSSTSYVALGDSFTAGPGIDPQQPDAGFCQRSAENWPSVLAASLDLDLTDVSCSGATTADLASTVESGAVSAAPSLVTVSAGGNDGGLFLALLRACSSGTDACESFVDAQAPPILAQTTTDLVALLESVRSDAPSATITLVGYPRIMPATGTCETVGIAAADVASVVAAETALDGALADAAEQAGVTYVSPREPSVGHDACAGDEAWTNGTSPASGDGIVFHPNRRGMAAMAGLVAAAIER